MAEPTRPITPDNPQGLKWYQGLERYCWIVLIIAALGWLFDTMDQNLYNIVRAPSLNHLLRPLHPGSEIENSAAAKALAADVKQKGGWITSIFLVGWSAGGFIFGVLGDRLGRTRTMIITILIYAIFTGLSGLAPNWQIYAFFRFMTALGVGGEWAAGAALVAETFPSRSRPMALGFLQALSAVGNMMAAVITFLLGNLENNWQIAYFIGAAPALLVLWIRRSVREPEKWKEAKEKATFGKELGSITELFTHPVLRRNTIAATLMATAGVGGLWGIGFFSADMLREELLIRGGEKAATVGRLTSIMFFLQQVGAFIGIYLFAVYSVRFSRRSAFVLWFALAWVSVLAFFWGIHGSGTSAFTRALVLAPIMGFCTLGPFSGYTIYFPELYPTRLRSTGCGFCYNAARILAAAAPLTLGGVAASLGGFHKAATVVAFVYLLGFVGAWMGPETKGKPLPEDKDFEERPQESPIARPVVATAQPE
jgi:MFS family permease